MNMVLYKKPIEYKFLKKKIYNPILSIGFYK